MPLDDVTAETVRGFHRQLEIDAAALVDGAERGHLQRLVHRLGLEALAINAGSRQTAAVDGNRVTEAQFSGKRSCNPQLGTVVPALDGIDLAHVFDQSREHVTTP